MATMADVPPEYDNIKSLDDRRKRPGPGIELTDYAGNLVLIDDPADTPPLPDNVVTIDRSRFERLRAAALEGIDNGIGPAYAEHFEDGDLDPIPYHQTSSIVRNRTSA